MRGPLGPPRAWPQNETGGRLRWPSHSCGTAPSSRGPAAILPTCQRGRTFNTHQHCLPLYHRRVHQKSIYSLPPSLLKEGCLVPVKLNRNVPLLLSNTNPTSNTHTLTLSFSHWHTNKTEPLLSLPLTHKHKLKKTCPQDYKRTKLSFMIHSSGLTSVSEWRRRQLCPCSSPERGRRRRRSSRWRRAGRTSSWQSGGRRTEHQGGLLAACRATRRESELESEESTSSYGGGRVRPGSRERINTMKIP